MHLLSKELVILSKILEKSHDKDYTDLLIKNHITLDNELSLLIEEVYNLDIILGDNYDMKIHPN